MVHLAADGVRGLAVIVAGIFAVVGVVEAATADTYCSLFVCVFVLVAACSLLQVVLRKTVPLAYQHFDEPSSPRERSDACEEDGIPDIAHSTLSGRLRKPQNAEMKLERTAAARKVGQSGAAPEEVAAEQKTPSYAAQESGDFEGPRDNKLQPTSIGAALSQ